MSAGPIALVGSGEFTPAMEEVDGELLEGRPQRVVFLPTAAAPEGEKSIAYWVDLGRLHYTRLGVEAVPLLVLDRAGADDDDANLASAIAGAGLVYLSGGDPTYLAATLLHTRVGDAIVAAWQNGAAVAGCSAGAVALTDYVPDVRHRGRTATGGLALVPHIVVLPHFDQLERWAPGVTKWALDSLPADRVLVGVDEETAMLGGPVEWRVRGRRHVWELSRGADPVGHAAGDTLSTPVRSASGS